MIKKILAIETSCDETSIALLKCGGTLKSPKFEVLENIVSSQIKIHRPFGGVVPNLAKREHITNLPKILANLTKKHKNIKTLVDYIAVTVGPGLEPALWTGIEFAKSLSMTLNKPLIGANHLEGHLYSNWLPIKEIRSKNYEIRKKFLKSYLLHPTSKIKFPAIALIVSGGHTILLHMTAINKWTKLGETLDDAAGEAFDKVARMLNLPYPGGPEIQKLAAQGNPNAIKFPRPMLNKKNYDFSFSGLKTSVLYYLRSKATNTSESTNKNSGYSDKFVVSDRLKADVAASFQQAVIDVLMKKTVRAAQEFNAKTILLCGGVSANKPLQETLKVESEKLSAKGGSASGGKVKFNVPEFRYNTDNAAMIAAAAYINLLQKNKKRLKIEAQGNLNL